MYAHLDYFHLPIPVQTLVRSLVAFIDVVSTKACVLFQVVAVLKDLMSTSDRNAEGIGEAPLKYIQETIITEFFLRENKHKLLFFELNSSRLDTLVKINRMSLIVNYSSSFGLGVTTEPTQRATLGHLLATDVQLLYHASLVELFSLCFDDCSDLNYLRCLSFDTVMVVLQTMEAYNCPPLVYAYGLFLYRIFLRGNGSSDYITRIDSGEKTTLDISQDERLYDALSKLCAAAMAPESLRNNHRRLIFDIAIPCVVSFLGQTLSLAVSGDQPTRNRGTDSMQEALFKLISQLLAHLMENRYSLSRQELKEVALAWQQLRIPVSPDLRAEYSASYASASSSPSVHAAADSESRERGEQVGEQGVEMTDRDGAEDKGSIHDRTNADTKEHVLSLLEHCPSLDQVGVKY